MAQSPSLNLSTEEEDPRSIQIRQECKPLAQYLEILINPDTYYPHENLEIFDDIFLSFIKEEDFNICSAALKLLFQRIEHYALEKANCKIAFNIGKLLDCYLTKFKDQLRDEDKINLHEIVTKISTDSFKLHQLKDTEFIIALVFLKHHDPVLYKEEAKEMLSRLENDEGTDNCVRSLVENIYKYPNEELKELIYFQLRSFVLIRNTMIVTEEFIMKTIKMLLEDYRDDWIAIFANKMLSHVIVPFVAHRVNKTNQDGIQVDDNLVLEWLLDFSEKSFGQKVRSDKWETIYEEDFALTWQFVREHASKNERKNFYKYLIDNGFEFHLTDPHVNICFNDVTSN